MPVGGERLQQAKIRLAADPGSRIAPVAVDPKAVQAGRDVDLAPLSLVTSSLLFSQILASLLVISSPERGGDGDPGARVRAIIRIFSLAVVNWDQYARAAHLIMASPK
jgi:hypothetical protein